MVLHFPFMSFTFFQFFFEEIKMRYINNGSETLLVQGVLKEPPRKPNILHRESEKWISQSPNKKEDSTTTYEYRTQKPCYVLLTTIESGILPYLTTDP
jgi:hypothetical protein